MDERILNMTGYEFENYISTLLTKLGFEVEVTQYSNDGGIDLIATYEKPIFSGKYIVQCKKWDSSVGQPEIRDLYGVVMDQRANKGVLITTSDFTSQAYDFAKGKNIELIDGTVLKSLIENSFDHNENIKTSSKSIYQNDRYLYLKNTINEEPQVPKNYLNMINYLREKARTQDDCNCTLELFDEIVQWADQMINRCLKSQSKSDDKNIVQLIQAEAYIHTGRLAEATEILLRNNRFYLSTNGACYSGNDGWKGGANERIIAWNLYAAYKSINYEQGCRLLQSKITSYDREFYNIFSKQYAILGNKFIYPKFKYFGLSGEKIRLEINEFEVADIRDPAYFYNRFYVQSDEDYEMQIDKIFELHGIV